MLQNTPIGAFEPSPTLQLLQLKETRIVGTRLAWVTSAELLCILTHRVEFNRMIHESRVEIEIKLRDSEAKRQMETNEVDPKRTDTSL